MKLGLLVLVTPLFAIDAFGGSDGFDGINCGSDIEKALIGRRMSNERVVELEKSTRIWLLRILAQARFPTAYHAFPG